MALLDYGLSSGLAYRHNFQQDIANAQRNEALDRQARIDAENRAKLMADDMKFGKANNEFDAAGLKGHTESIIRGLGEFYNQNPDWQVNPTKYALQKELKNSLVDNPYTRRAMNYDSNVKMLADWTNKHPDQLDRPEIQRAFQQAKAYRMNGNADENGNINEFMFVPPKPFTDIAKEGVELGNKFKDFDYHKIKGEGDGAYVPIPKEESLRSLANDYYKRHKDQFDYEYSKKGFSSPEEQAYYNIRAGINAKADYGDYGSRDRRAYGYGDKNKPPIKGAYKINVLEKDSGTTNPEVLDKAIGQYPGKVFMPPATEYEVPLEFDGDEVFWTGTHSKVVDKKSHMADNKNVKGYGKKYLDGYVLKDRDWAVDHGIVKGYVGRLEDEEGKGDLAAGWEKSGIELIKQPAKTKNDVDQWKVKIPIKYELDEKNPVIQQRYDEAASPTKYVPKPEDYNEEEQTITKSSGKRYRVQMPDGTIGVVDEEGNVIE